MVTHSKEVAPFIKDQHEALKKATDSMEVLFKTERGNPYTEALQALDQRRDNAIVGINMHVQGLTYHPDPAIRLPAEILNRHLLLYGGSISKENYQSETAILDNILKDWVKKPKLSKAITALGLSSWVAELGQANRAFNEAFMSRASEMGSRIPESFRSRRYAAMQAYYVFRDYFNSYHTIHKGAAPFTKLADALNELIAEYNTLMKGRNASSRNGKTNKGY